MELHNHSLSPIDISEYTSFPGTSRSSPFHFPSSILDDDVESVENFTPASQKRKEMVDLTGDSDEEVVEIFPKPKKQRVMDRLPSISDIGKGNKEEERDHPRNSRTSKKIPSSKAMKLRIHEAQTQRIFVIQQKPTKEENSEREFVVLGTTGNVYDVKICSKPTCTCTDNNNGASRYHCKHILFILLKVFKLSSSDLRIFQKILLNSEVTDIFSQYGGTNGLMADSLVTEKYLEVMSGGKVRRKKMRVQKAIEGDCPICYERMKPTENIVWCKYGCGNNVHKDCFDQWIETKTEKSVDEVKCVYCRAPWDLDSLKSYFYKDGYLNLADYQDRQPTMPANMWILSQLINRMRPEQLALLANRHFRRMSGDDQPDEDSSSEDDSDY